MPVLFLESGGEQREISFHTGQTLREILDTTDLRVTSACSGNGMCGLCHIKIFKGKINEPLPNERLALSERQIQNGIRLACQVIPEQDVWAVLQNPAPKSNWRSLNENEYNEISFPGNSGTEPCFSSQSTSLGAAIDLGTTHISLTIWDLEKKCRLSGRSGPNEQQIFGSDIISRLTAACESKENSSEISSLAKNSISTALHDIYTREYIDIAKIKKMVLVGNTAMLSLITAKNFDMLHKPQYWSVPIDYQPDDTENLRKYWGIHKESSIKFVPPVSGFVGSDLLAGVLATHLTKSKKTSLLIDFGTNTEIALWDGAHLWVASAAGGPAFEGCGISLGMPAEFGAIYSLFPVDDDKKYDFAVTSGAQPRGFCGSGLIDLIAYLINSKDINAKGLISRSDSTDGIAVLEEYQLRLKKRDIDIFQRAKSAIASCIIALMKSAGIPFNDLQRICVCGAFGRFLNIQNAQSIGLLPEIPNAMIELCGNTALTGCELILLSGSDAEELENLREKIKYINIAENTDFDELFFDNLYLKPMKRDTI